MLCICDRIETGQLEPVLSGTSLAGVLRHRAERIVNTLGKAPGNCQGFIRLCGGRQQTGKSKSPSGTRERNRKYG
jgi:hypothetical protein